MNVETSPDPAAVFGCAISLWHECKKPAKAAEKVNLSACYNGGDEFMRVVMRVATRFETWASDLVEFEELDDVWPYMMEDRFGAACVEVMGAENLASFNDSDCLRVALRLRLPVKLSAGFCIYIETICQGPVPIVSDENGYVVFETEMEAQKEIADYAMTRLRQFMDDERDFDDAITVEEYVVPVTVHPGGSFTDEDGRCFGPRTE